MAISDGIPAISQLAVTFGGFSPTAMSSVELTREQIDRVERDQARKKEAARKRRQLEMARTSKPKVYEDEAHVTWTYVVVDDKFVRIVACGGEAAKLEVPSEIEGLSVYGLGADCCARLELVEEIICPDSVEAIGSCAFRLCPNLRRLVLPASVAEFNGLWVQHCPSLEELVLPGGLDIIKPDVFENAGLSRLFIGDSVHSIEAGAFQKSKLTELVVDERNPFIKTDGAGIYTHDGTQLVAYAVPREHYEVQEGCQIIGRKAFYGAEALRQVKLPDTVCELQAFAFAHSGIASFAASSKLHTIGEKAFYYCRKLESIQLNEGLREIGDSAFEESALASLAIPATIEHIGNSMTVRTNIVHSGLDCSLTIDKASQKLFLDGQGGLYKREGDEIHLVQLVDREALEYAVLDGATHVDAYAFAHQVKLERVCIPESVTEIGASAFRNCAALAQVDLPDTLRCIGDEAFLDTQLETLRVPRMLETLGRSALVTVGAHRGENVPSLRHVEVAEGNERFYVASGMLCRRGASAETSAAADSVILFSNSEEDVVFPESIASVEDYAFNNARGIRRLRLNKNLKTIGRSGLSTWCWIELIQVEVAEPLEGRTFFEFRFPDTYKGLHGISTGIGGASWVNVPGIFAQYDISLVSAHDYNAPRNQDSVSIYEQVVRVLERLDDPILLTNYNREMYHRLLRNHITEICVDVARHDDRRAIDSLIELGYLNNDNIEDIVVAVGKLQDAAMTGYLLELKRRRFGRAAFDFDL